LTRTDDDGGEDGNEENLDEKTHQDRSHHCLRFVDRQLSSTPWS
jgi:hypothetical protein